jgi:serine/threonine protein kinase
MPDPVDPPAEPTPSFRPPADGETPSYSPAEPDPNAPTPTQQTPSDYVPPRYPPAALPDDADPPTGGRYTPTTFHNKGGMGRVFAAQDSELNRRVALKDIHPRHRAKDWYRRKFIFEAEVTGELEHPGVVPVYGLTRPRDGCDHPHYAMRFIEGQSLGEAIAAFHRAGPTTSLTNEQWVALRRLLARFLAVCETIAYAHSRGVIHRDLKPGNVLLGPFGETLVVDWGLAKRLCGGETAPGPDAAEPRAASTGGGTPAYWSPEQAAKATHLHDERTDVYGLGAVLFHILTGRPPHPTGDHAAEAPRPAAAAPWVDAALDAVVRKALAPERAARYHSVRGLAWDIEQWMADQPVAAQRAAVAMLRGRAGAAAEDPVLQEQFARQLSNLGQIYQGMGRDEEAVAALLEASGVFAAMFQANRAQPRFRAEEANCYLASARSLERLGRPADAEERVREATQIYSGLIAAHPDEYKANFATIIITKAHALPVPEPSDPATEVRDGEPGTNPESSTGGVSDDLGEPELVQGYTVQRVLGVGGSGRVLLARDNALRRLVAIKEFTQEFTGVRGQRFLREIQLTANLRHPNIVQVYTYGVHAGSGRPFLVMEYVEGRNLQEEARAFHVRRPNQRGTTALTEGVDPPRRASPDLRATVLSGNAEFYRLLRALCQACDAVHFAHQSGIAHRDAKPANVIVDPNGAAVLIDWGIAKGFGEQRDLAAEDAGGPTDGFTESMTRTGQIVGTPSYIAPEQFGEKPTTAATQDVYTLGVGLFEILTGQLPWTGTAYEVMFEKANSPPPRPRDMTPLPLPPELEAICLKAMSRRPRDRYPSAAEMATELRQWIKNDSWGFKVASRRQKWTSTIFIAGLFFILAFTLTVILVRNLK